MAGRPHGELSDPRNKFVHQVFLSFRGEDVRNGFEGHLFSSMQGEGFRVFIDNDGLEHGRDIQMKLLEAIEQSKVFIVTLSPRYAESRWCLDELAKIMELNKVSPNRFVLPVFFNVEPTDVRHQTGLLNTEFFEAHEKRFGAEISRVDNWRWALKEVAALKGPSLKDANGNEAQLIQNIIKELRRILATHDLALPPNIIGVDTIVRDICTWIQDGSPDAGVGVIHGQGGIGKTTIAKIVFNANYDDFEGSSFIEDIRKSSEQDNSFLRLQRKLILDISRYEAGAIYNVSEAMTKIRNAIGPKRILLVLDDVEEMEHLGGLLDHPEWFCPGSKIIVTTRNQQIKNIRMFKQEFKIRHLNYEESRKLFSLLIFDQNHPLKGYEELSHKFVNYCGGLPLALCVLAPLLRGIKDKEIWRDRLHKLEKLPNKRIQVVLKMSFDSLDDEADRNLFLHIALFFVGRDKEYSFKILEDCEIYSKAGFQSLADRCLVSISGDKLIMHHLVQEMGREVVRQESVNEPGLRSRLWDHKETLNVLRKNKGTPSVKGLRLAFPAPKTVTLKENNHIPHVSNGIGLASILSPTIPSRRMTSNLEFINTVAFTNMDNLNLLLLSYVQLKGGFDNFPKEIKWLWWQGCSLESIPQNLLLRELVVLDMQHSQLLSAWEDKKELGALKILNLSHSYCLRSTPDLSNADNLEWIILEGCISLVKMHDSIGCLRKLTYLNLKGCKNLKSICQLQSIKRVDLSGCSRLFTELSLSQSQILRSLFSSLNLFTSTVKLNLRNCGVRVSLDAILDSSSCFTSLEEVDLSYNSFEEIKKDFWHFTRLYNKRLERFKNLRSISQSPWVNMFAPECASPEKVEYQQNQYLEDSNVSAYNYPESAETEGLLKLEAETKLDVIKDPKLETFRNSSIPLASGGVYYGLWKGVCQCEIYSVILHGDLILGEWFTVKRPGSEILYTFPWRPDHPIRAFNVCCVYQCGRYQKSIRGRLQVENLTRKRTWLYFPEIYPMHPELDQGTKVTWFSYWKVMEVQHIDVRDGDTLKVSFDQSGGNIPVKCKMNIFYKVGEEDVDIEMTEVIPDNIVATVNLLEFQ
ncbi:hypothetical protein QQ045_003797 [Rhodiola kirilowii]